MTAQPLDGLRLAVPADCDQADRTAYGALTSLIDGRTGRRNTLGNKIVSRMGDFRQQYPLETADFDDSVLSAGGYRELHRRLVDDDLPRFQAQFKTYLNTNTIRDIAGFHSQLNKQGQLIRERVATINESLVGVDYNPGRYIRLEAQRTPNVEIRDFAAELRACTDDSISGDGSDQYSEQKFLQVSRIIERFRGREGQAEADAAWTKRVTDVRNWYIFSASERWREDDTEYENYTDSGGKSGGQKEKLAYTILAASLAYQFKLEWGATRSKTFRFVVIDEAFGRGSDESTRFALELFRRLGLQLLIVTPLQKIHVIEPYVSAVGFVDNPEHNNSRLQTLTIEEYRARQLAHMLSQQVTAPAAAAAPTSSAARPGRPCPPRPPPGAEVPAAAAGPRAWTSPADVLGLLRRRWQAGLLLSAFASGQDWQPLGIPLRGPSAGQLAERFAEVRAWAARWEQADPKLTAAGVQEGRRPGDRVEPDPVPGLDRQLRPALGAARGRQGRAQVRRAGGRDQGQLPPAGPVDDGAPDAGAGTSRVLGGAYRHRPLDSRLPAAGHVPARDRRARLRHEVHRAAPGRAG